MLKQSSDAVPSQVIGTSNGNYVFIFKKFINGLGQNLGNKITSVDVSVFTWCCLRNNHRAVVGPNPEL